MRTPRLPLLALFSVVVLLSSACSSDGDALSTTGEPRRLDRKAITAVFEGSLVEAATELGDFDVIIERVYWSLERTVSTEGLVVLYRPLSMGDRIPLDGNASARLRVGETYLFTASHSAPGAPDADQWLSAWVTYDLDTMQPREDAYPPLDVLLGPGEDGPTARRTALVELIADSMTALQAEWLGEPAPPAGPRLARLRAWEAAQEPTGNDVVAARVDAYLALDPLDRQLLELEGMLPGTVAALGLEPIRIIVLYDKQYADDVWAIGFRDPAGFIGPYVVGALGVDEMWGTHTPGGDLQLIVWTEPPTSTSFGREAQSVSDSVLTSAIADVHPATGEVLVVDIENRFAFTTTHVAGDDLMLSRSQ